MQSTSTLTPKFVQRLNRLVPQSLGKKVRSAVLSVMLMSPWLQQPTGTFLDPLIVVKAQTTSAVTKSTSTSSVTAGQTATYTITVRNTSTSGTWTGVSIRDDLPSGFVYRAMVGSPTLSGGATRTATVNPAAGAISLNWGTFSIPVGGSVAFTFTVDVDTSTTPRTYDNSVAVTYTRSSTTTTVNYTGSSSTAEDVTVTAPTPSSLPSVGVAPTGNACATPGKDGSSTTLSGVLNTYYPGVSVSGKTLTVGTAAGASTPIAKGDLLLIIQMQDATIDTTNSAQYGSGNANNAGSGQSNYGSSGAYEYAVADSAVSGGTIQLVSALSQTFTNSNASVQGQRRFQVIRVPQYRDATLSGTVSALPWNGQVGGVVVLDVSGTLTFSNSKIVATGTGFRGGGGVNVGGGAASSVVNRDYVSLSSAGYHGSKGEGIAGTPRRTRTPVTIDNTTGVVTAGTSVNAGSDEGWTSGSFGRGAPGNAGGGGTDPNQDTNAANTGGGGGANYGTGGKGGDSWYDGFNRQPLGGLGGTAFPTSVNRIVMGGGGGAATANNSDSGNVPSGGSGGGIVLVRAKTIAGTGSIEANGIAGVSPSSTDGGGAGGAGGTVLIQALTASSPSLSISVTGGNGANSGHHGHGPGGGGGGGYVAYQGFSPSTSLSGGGSPGNDVSGSGNSYGFTDPYENSSPDPYGATSGGAGLAQAVSIPTAGVASGAACSKPLVLLSKRITAIKSQGTTTNFTTVFTPTSIQTSDPNAGNAYWPANYLKGGGVIDAGASPTDPVDSFTHRPGDEIEYTIYFLSAGDNAAEKVQFCDRIPANQTFLSQAFNSDVLFPQAAGGTAGADRGIAVSYNSQNLSYTNNDDGDTARFYAAGATLPSLCGTGANLTGAIVVNLGSGATATNGTNLGGTLPTANTTPATPATSYGFVRFRAKTNN